MPQISVNYILLFGQFLLLFTVLLLQSLEGIHSQNSTEPPGNRVTTSKTVLISEQPEENVTESVTTLPTETSNHTEQYEYSPPSPVVLCRYLPEEFIFCQDPVDHGGNVSAFQELGYGCVKFGGQVYKDVNHTKVLCTALDGIECAGPREFFRGNEPCIKRKSFKWQTFVQKNNNNRIPQEECHHRTEVLQEKYSLDKYAKAFMVYDQDINLDLNEGYNSMKGASGPR
ncbi:TM2 domain-containing protein 2 isoform X2 [Cyprinus carpio]|uniref:TM2 domain-containing protein 2 isoform X2 n=1 Tax=Cyprinus carpio TaxID=7962 RepID=A0A9Q9WAL4_CYPCA|nr:TM2 domain-containing protein 2 isoform X2 [Cyprinus carpio]